MPAPLLVKPFGRESLPMLDGFDCGQDQFGVLASDWIRCTHSEHNALTAMDRGNEVFLYFTPENHLVGFGSLGKTRRKVKGETQDWSIIPQVGIRFDLRGHPENCNWKDRYGASIVIDLMAAARGHQTPILMLKVHERNIGAKVLYERLGFHVFAGPNADGYSTMVIENGQ